MKGFVEFVKTTLAGGFFVILPIVLIVFLLSQMVGVLIALVTPIADALPVETLGGVEVALLLAVVAALGVCLAAGVLVRTRVGSNANAWLERNVLSNVPGYSLVKNLTQRFAPGDQGTAVLARLQGDAWALAFLVEEIDEREVAVFVPLAPTPTVGSIHVLPRDHVRVLEVTMTAAVNCVMQWGIGTKDLMNARK